MNANNNVANFGKNRFDEMINVLAKSERGLATVVNNVLEQVTMGSTRIDSIIDSSWLTCILAGCANTTVAGGEMVKREFRVSLTDKGLMCSINGAEPIMIISREQWLSHRVKFYEFLTALDADDLVCMSEQSIKRALGRGVKASIGRVTHEPCNSAIWANVSFDTGHTAQIVLSEEDELWLRLFSKDEQVVTSIDGTKKAAMSAGSYDRSLMLTSLASFSVKKEAPSIIGTLSTMDTTELETLVSDILSMDSGNIVEFEIDDDMSGVLSGSPTPGWASAWSSSYAETSNWFMCELQLVDNELWCHIYPEVVYTVALESRFWKNGRRSEERFFTMNQKADGYETLRDALDRDLAGLCVEESLDSTDVHSVRIL